MPLRFEPPVNSSADLTVLQAGQPIRPDQIRWWLQAEPARQLPNLAKVPTVIVTGEASFRATMDDCTNGFLAQAGAKPDRLALAEHGVMGNGHMMMLTANNGVVADVIIDWTEAKTRWLPVVVGMNLYRTAYRNRDLPPL